VIGSNDNVQDRFATRTDFTGRGEPLDRVARGRADRLRGYQLAFEHHRPTLLAPAGQAPDAAHASGRRRGPARWVNTTYDGVRVYRDGALVAELPGSTIEHTDMADRGLHLYEVAGVRASSETDRVHSYEFAGLLSCFASDDFESGNADLWVREESAPGSSWDVVPFAQSGTWGFSDSPAGVPYRGCPTGEAGCHVNAIAEFGVPAVLTSGASLEWDQICITEATYDFCIVEISDDDGLSWTELARYDQTSDPGWEDSVADPSDWRHAAIDLGAYADQEVRIRFRLESDSNLEFDGWYVDNVQLSDPVCLTVDVEDLAEAGVYQLLLIAINELIDPCLALLRG
jgi:hypothetical protein